MRVLRLTLGRGQHILRRASAEGWALCPRDPPLGAGSCTHVSLKPIYISVTFSRNLRPLMSEGWGHEGSDTAVELLSFSLTQLGGEGVVEFPTFI